MSSQRLCRRKLDRLRQFEVGGASVFLQSAKESEVDAVEGEVLHFCFLINGLGEMLLH
jgi:hypothetical protein